ncbi:MAG: hypothetical protein F6K41_00615 [Symploca sp. SIO3E6]|nr:hypothetical protein [Caldora sp. SIO3E6]
MTLPYLINSKKSQRQEHSLAPPLLRSPASSAFHLKLTPMVAASCLLPPASCLGA